MRYEIDEKFRKSHIYRKSQFTDRMHNIALTEFVDTVFKQFHTQSATFYLRTREH